MWIDERLQIVAIKIGRFVFKDNFVLDEEEYFLKIEVEILQPTIQVEKYKCMDLLMFIFFLWICKSIVEKNRKVLKKRR